MTEPGSPQRGTYWGRCLTLGVGLSHWGLHAKTPECRDWCPISPAPMEAVTQSEPSPAPAILRREPFRKAAKEYAESHILGQWGQDLLAEMLADFASLQARAGLSTQGTSELARLVGKLSMAMGNPAVEFGEYKSIEEAVVDLAVERLKGAQGTSEDERALAAAIVEIVFNELDRDCNWLTGEDHAIGLVQKRLMRARASSLPKESPK